MSTAHEVAERLHGCGVVAVVRASDGSQLVRVAEALAAGGIDAVEVTFTVPNAVECIQELVRALGDRVVVGAGTVLDAATARHAILAGARFVVSPILDEELVRLCRRYSVFVAPGAFTPTEVVRAWSAGADAVKVFPADVGGPRYLKALRGPLPQVRLFPTGGVTPQTVGDFLAAGAWCLGAGSALVSPQAIASRDWGEIERRAREFRTAVEVFRSARPST